MHIDRGLLSINAILQQRVPTIGNILSNIIYNMVIYIRRTVNYDIEKDMTCKATMYISLQWFVPSWYLQFKADVTLVL